MTGTDLVVVLPGIMGSTLRRIDGELVWAPSAGAALRAIATLAGSIKQLTLDPDIGDQAPDDGVEPVALMPDLHVLPGVWTPIKGYTRLLRRLTSLGYRTGANLLPVPYDWRLSNRYNGRRLASIVEPALQRWRDQSPANADAQLVFVCHSMGGLVARWYIERCGGAELTRRLITFGTPYRGAAKAVDQLVNGVRPGLGPLAVDLTTFARSLPSLHQLLPEYACIEHRSDLAKTTEVTLPELDSRLVADAMTFHTELNDAEATRPASLEGTHAIVGTRQPTVTTVRIDGHRAIPLETIGPDNDYGDATVPLAGGIRHGLALDTNRINRVADHHGNLQRNGAALDVLEGILTAKPVVRRDAHATVELRVSVPELLLAGADLPVAVTTVAVTEGGTARQAIMITVRDEAGMVVASAVPRLRKGHAETAFTALPPGAYAVEVAGLDTGSGVAPVSADVLIWGDHPPGTRSERATALLGTKDPCIRSASRQGDRARGRQQTVSGYDQLVRLCRAAGVADVVAVGVAGVGSAPADPSQEAELRHTLTVGAGSTRFASSAGGAGGQQRQEGTGRQRLHVQVAEFAEAHHVRHRTP